jgi:hypothetical protein
VRVAADKDVFLQRLADVARFLRGPSTLAIGAFSRLPAVSDLDGLTIDDADLSALRACRPGRCDVKLTHAALDRLRREVDWSAPDARDRATAVMKRMLVDYVAAYQKSGVAEMGAAVDRAEPVDLAAEYHKVLGASPYHVRYAPELHRYLEEFPRRRLAGAEDIFYWTKDKFGPKPTIAVHHLTIWRDPADAARVAIAFKQIYASHYFRAGLELVALVDAPSPPGGFYLIDLYRARIDPPTGALAGVLLGKIQGGIEQGVAEKLRTAKERTESR